MTTPPRSFIGIARALAVAALLSTCWWAAPRPTILADPLQRPKQTVKKYALQVGCTEYPNCSAIPALVGPANDVPLLAKLLHERFGFPAENMTQLVGWPADEKKRPTCANIFTAFEDLIAKADDETQIVIQLSGHGTQVPIPVGQHPLDPKNFEPDGLDEVFLPADVETDKDGVLKNHILDDQMGVWLDKLCAKGAAVWIIFDCCHSGTMDRGNGPGPNDTERTREVNPVVSNLVKKADWDDAVKRGEDAVKEAIAKGTMDKDGRMKDGRMAEAGGFGVNGAKGKKGSMVAFYGAQSFEKAPELLRPEGAPRDTKNWYGLLSWTLVKTLEQQSGMLTYRELAQAMVGQYACERGGAPPTPFAEGDLDREVLGLKTWPARSALLMKKEKKGLTVSGGACQGLTDGSVLAVYSKAKDPVGYVQVTKLEPTTARVKACGYGGKDAVKIDDLPDLGRCELLTRDFGDMKIRLALGKPQDPGDAKLVQDLAGGLSKEIKAMVKLMPNEAEAQWILTVHKGQVQLREAEGRILEKDRLAQPSDALARVFAVAGAKEGIKVLPFLERDLQRIFSSQNMWRVAGLMGNNGSATGLKLVFKKLDADDKEVGPLTSGEPLAAGQKLEITLRNTGLTDLWIRILGMDGSFGIKVYKTSIPGGQDYGPLTVEIDDTTVGKEGFIVLAGSLGKGEVGPDLSFLGQAKLNEGLREVRDQRGAPDSPWGQLLQAATTGSGTRSGDIMAPTNPTMVSVSWVTVASKKAASK